MPLLCTLHKRDSNVYGEFHTVCVEWRKKLVEASHSHRHTYFPPFRSFVCSFRLSYSYIIILIGFLCCELSNYEANNTNGFHGSNHICIRARHGKWQTFSTIIQFDEKYASHSKCAGSSNGKGNVTPMKKKKKSGSNKRMHAHTRIFSKWLLCVAYNLRKTFSRNSTKHMLVTLACVPNWLCMPPT